jgi:hypothetical protein
MGRHSYLRTEAGTFFWRTSSLEAMRTAGEALNAATSLCSGRTARSVHGVRALDQFPDLPAVEEFADMVRSRLPVALPPPER